MARYDRTIPPGGVGTIALRLNTRGYQGVIQKRAQIFTNDPSGKIQTITIKASVKVYIFVSARYVYLRGVVGKKIIRTVTIRAGQDKSLHLEQAYFNLGKRVAYEIEEVEAGKKFRIRFSATPDTMGAYRGVLRLKINYSEKPEIAIHVIAQFYKAGAMKKKPAGN